MDFKKGDRIIWDSHFGYEIGYFIEDSHDKMYNSSNVELVTGIVTEPGMKSNSELLPYTKENLEKMVSKYKKVLFFKNRL